MKVTVKLYGTLSRDFPAYEHARGLEVEVRDGATAGDLLALLGIPEGQKAVVAVKGRFLKGNEKLELGDPIGVFQPIHGG